MSEAGDIYQTFIWKTQEGIPWDHGLCIFLVLRWSVLNADQSFHGAILALYGLASRAADKQTQAVPFDQELS